MSTADLPTLNAVLNSLATVLLISAYISIRLRHVRAHAILMVSALVVSGLFLVFYLIHKAYHPNISSAYMGTFWRIMYLLILIPHVILAVVMLPMIFQTFRRAIARRFEQHKRIAKPTLLIWVYVSITGVVIYFWLYFWFPRPDA